MLSEILQKIENLQRLEGDKFWQYYQHIISYQIQCGDPQSLVIFEQALEMFRNGDKYFDNLQCPRTRQYNYTCLKNRVGYRKEKILVQYNEYIKKKQIQKRKQKVKSFFSSIWHTVIQKPLAISMISEQLKSQSQSIKNLNKQKPQFKEENCSNGLKLQGKCQQTFEKTDKCQINENRSSKDLLKLLESSKVILRKQKYV